MGISSLAGWIVTPKMGVYAATKMFPEVYCDGLHLDLRSAGLRRVEDAGTVTSPLVPWNSCGAYMAGVLGVATISYLPYAFFNLLSPLVSLVYAFTGFRIERVDPGPEGTAGTPQEAPADAPVSP